MRDDAEFYRTHCLETYAIAVRRGFFLAARLMLRNALRFREHGRENSVAVDYFFSGGRLSWYYWGN